MIIENECKKIKKDEVIEILLELLDDVSEISHPMAEQAMEKVFNYFKKDE